MRSPPEWDTVRCIRCVACVGSCPSGAIVFRSNSMIIDRNRCTACQRCVLFCPEGCFKEGVQ